MCEQTREVKLITRDSGLVIALADREIKLTGSGYYDHTDIKEVGKNKYKNCCLEDIQFEYKGQLYEIEHCWLQECDYTPWFKRNGVEGELYYIEFTFYRYRDKKDGSMCGMNVSYIEPY